MNDKKVDLETLLRLKRAEMPHPEFWKRFDQELRVKQLAAIVKREPWWHRLSIPFGLQIRYIVPAGAAALLLFTVFVARPHPHVALAKSTIAQAPAARLEAVSPVAGVSVNVGPATATVAVAANLGSRSSVADVELAGEASSQDVSSLLPVMTATVAANDTENSPSLSAMLSPVESAVNMNAASIPVSLSGPVDTNFAANFSGGTSVADPLSQMESPADRRRTRLLASALPSNGANPTLATDRVASKLSDDRLTEEAIRRFGARGDRVLVKF